MARLPDIMGPGAPAIPERPDICPHCGGAATVDLNGTVTGFIHRVNCPVMVQLREEYSANLVTVDRGHWRDDYV